MKKILFVCMDNTCRSIMAESVLCSVRKEQKVEVASRGLIVLFPEPLNPKAVAVLTGNQMAPRKESSEPLCKEDITEDTLILTMTAQEAEMVKQDFPEAEHVYTLGDFTGKPGDIEAPHGGTLAEYGACYEYIDLLVKFAAESIFRNTREEKVQERKLDDILIKDDMK